MDDAEIFWVDSDGGADTNAGTMPSEAFEHIQHAIDSVQALGTGVVFVEDSPVDYIETLTVQGKTIALVGIGAASPELIGNGGTGLTLNSGAIVFMSRFEVRGSTFEGISCNGPVLWLDDSAVYNNGADGVAVGSGCTAKLRNVMVSGHIANGEEHHEINNEGMLELRYSTLFATGLGEVALGCGLSATTSVSNSVIVTDIVGPYLCDGISFETTAINGVGIGMEPPGTTHAGTYDTGWFFGAAAGDLRLAGDGSGTPFGGLAMLGDDDLTTDIDGDDRPDAGFVGADEP